MRLLILSVCALSLSACSMGGLGFGSGHTGYEAPPPVGYGNWQGSHQAGYAQTSYAQAGGYGYGQTPCSAPVAPPVQSYPCGAPTYVAPVTPCHQPVQTPCSAAQAQPINYAAQYVSPQPVSYPNGYPTAPMPAHYGQPQAPGCGLSACSSQYAVSPYAYDSGHEAHDYSYGQTNYAPQTPSPYAYGTQAGSYYPSAGHGSHAVTRQNDAHFYGTLGAVWYDVGRPYAGLQGRLGYQATPILGAEIEGSIGVINEVSPFNQDVGGGVILSGEFKDGVDYSAAAFATARLPLSRNISTHARVGYHTTRTFADVDFDSNPDQQTTTTLDGIAYGAGIQMDITPVDAIRADFTRYDSDTADNDSVSLAYLRRF
ncbi:hypothetical protein GCM10009069_28810 [Algimonas arctica]|uniref:Outer membrane protein beta-barrel domain-containing protein n=1 Tax=Algimonas arctica TaxID=1479486 RepID=A0A8J3CTL7_9PROT|nr:outer membrane beta-barrel protein [Algimonas arctica]GHB04450.1 hypothetical protein GCM10009069_28810 [Algimonas arctica]